jgi:hypothetical protein
MSVHVHYYTKTALKSLKKLLQNQRKSLGELGSWFPSTQDGNVRSFFIRPMGIVVPSFAIKKYIQQWLVEEGLYLGIEVLTLDEVAREIVNYSDNTMVRESPLFSFFLRQVCRNFRRNGMWIDVKDEDGQYHKVHHQSVLLKHLLDENGAEIFEDALQSLQESILEIIEAKAGILLADNILGESYWSEFYELLTNTTQVLNSKTQSFTNSDSNHVQNHVQNQAEGLMPSSIKEITQSKKTEQLSLFSLLASSNGPSEVATKKDIQKDIQEDIQEDIQKEKETSSDVDILAENSNNLVVRVLEIFAILRGILQQEYRFFDQEEHPASSFPQRPKPTKNAIPIREMILSQASEYLAQIQSQQEMGLHDHNMVHALPYSYLCIYGFTSASGLYSDLLEKMIGVLDVDVLLLKTTTPFSFSSDASNEIVSRLIHQQLMLSKPPKEAIQEEREIYIELCEQDFTNHQELIHWHLQSNYLHPNSDLLDPWIEFVNSDRTDFFEASSNQERSTHEPLLEDNLIIEQKQKHRNISRKNESNVFVQKNKMPLYVEATKALGSQAEIRWVCNRILQLHQQGVPYEDMAIIRRNKEGLLSILFEETQRLGIPFSFVGDVVEHTSLSRRISLFMKLLRDRSNISLDVFFATSDSFFHSISKSEWECFIEEYGITSLRQMSHISHISTMGSLLQVKQEFIRFLSEQASEPSFESSKKLTIQGARALDAILEPLLSEQIHQAYLKVEQGVTFFPILHKLQEFREKLQNENRADYVVPTSILSHVVVDRNKKRISRMKKKFNAIDVLEIELRTHMILIACSKIKHQKMSIAEIQSITLLLMELLGWYLPSTAFVDNERSWIQSVMDRVILESKHFLEEVGIEEVGIEEVDRTEKNLHIHIDMDSDIDLENKLSQKRIFYWRDWLQLLGEQLSSIRNKQPTSSDSLFLQNTQNITGSGGGVQVLDAQEGQGRFFQHMFLLQMNSRVFPQTQEEDPLFPDVLRRKVISILPDLCLRSERGLQERHLFHILMTSARFVYLSYLAVDENGKEQNMSPLISPFPFAFFTSPSLYSSKFTTKGKEECSHLQKLPLPPEEAVVQIGLAGDLSSEGERSLFSLAYRELLKSSAIHNPFLFQQLYSTVNNVLFGWNDSIQDQVSISQINKNNISNKYENKEQMYRNPEEQSLEDDFRSTEGRTKKTDGLALHILFQHRLQSLTNSLIESIAEHYPAPFAIESTEMGPFSGLIGRNLYHFTTEDLDASLPLQDSYSSHLSFEQSMYITTIESMIRCPFKLFLEKLLYAKPTKSKREFLPQVALFSTGQIVHNTLEELVEQQISHSSLYDAISHGAVDIGIPSNEDLLPTIHTKTNEELSSQGTILTGFHALAAESTVGFFDVFREHVSSINQNNENQEQIEEQQLEIQQAQSEREEDAKISTPNHDVLQKCLGAELDGGFCIEVPFESLKNTLSTHERVETSTEDTDQQNPEIKLADGFLTDEISWDAFGVGTDLQHRHPIFHVQFKADRIDYVPKTSILHRIDENQSVYCRTKCDKKKTCWCALSNQPTGDYIHFVDYKTGKPVSDEKKELKRCTKFFESTASGSKLQSLAYAASGPYLRREFKKRQQQEISCTELNIENISRSEIENQTVENQTVENQSIESGVLEPLIQTDEDSRIDVSHIPLQRKKFPISEDFKTSGSLHYIKPDEIPQREFTATEDTLSSLRGDESQLEYLGKSVASVILGRSLGFFFPRLVRSKVSEPSKVQDFHDNTSCDYCDVRQACRVWDSAERKKLIFSLEDSVRKSSKKIDVAELHVVEVDGSASQKVSALPKKRSVEIKTHILKKLWNIGRK